jgi:hypothetical protein
MTRYGRTFLLIAAASVGASACLQKDTMHTWYLDPSGVVTWSVLEKDVFSDAKAEGDRQDEEAKYIAPVRAHNSPIARGMAQLGATDVRITILRDVTPFSVITQGRFASLGDLGQRIIGRTGLVGTSTFDRTAETSSWTMTVRDPKADTPNEDEDIGALVEELDHLRIILLKGHFTAAEHFTLSADNRVATVITDESMDKAMEDGAPLVFKLSWSR